MMKRPIPVTLVAWLYIATGAIGLGSHLAGSLPPHTFQYDTLWASLVALAAIVSGAYMLRACNWARWLAIAWIAFHVVLSAFHSRFELAMHSLFAAAFAYLLFRPASTRYFSALKKSGTP